MFEMLWRQLFKAVGWPILDNLVWEDDYAAFIPYLVHHDIAWTVSGEYILFGRSGKMKLQQGLHLRQFDGSGNITSFSVQDKAINRASN
jgi:hypothetical protein